MAENALDVEAATGKISDALLQRLILKPAKLKLLAGGWVGGRGQQAGRGRPGGGRRWQPGYGLRGWRAPGAGACPAPSPSLSSLAEAPSSARGPVVVHSWAPRRTSACRGAAQLHRCSCGLPAVPPFQLGFGRRPK